MSKPDYIKFAIFKTPPWNCDVSVAYGSPELFTKFALEAYNFKCEIYGLGHTFTETGMPVVIFVEDLKHIPTLVHELMHAVFFILGDRGVGYCAESEEAFTYTVGQLLTDVLACKIWKKVT